MTESDRRMRPLAASLLLVALVAGLSSVGCAKKAQGGPAPGTATKKQAIPVATMPVRLGDISSRFTLTGTVTPRQQANLSAVASGQVLTVNAQIGDRVGAGQLVVKIDDATLRAQLQQDEAALASAKARLAQTRANSSGNAATTTASLQSAKVAFDTANANLRRNKELFAQGYVSQSAVDQAQQQLMVAWAQLRAAQVSAQNADLSAGGGTAALADIRAAEAAVAQAQAARQFHETQISQTYVRAPFDGVVTARNVDPGTLSEPGMTLVQVSQLDPTYVNVGIPDADLTYVRSGTTVDIRVDSLPGRRWRARIEHLNAATSQGTLSYLARIAVPNGDLALKGGMVANVDFVKAVHRNVMIVPRTAVFTTERGDAVFVSDDGKAKVVAVRRGIESEAEVEVQSAELHSGRQVLTQRPDSLQPGALIEVVGSKGG